MQRIWSLVLLTTTFLVLPGYAQNPSDLTFVLAPANDRTSFRMGEAIDVEFRFSSTAPGKYVVSTEYQAKFIADPADGVASPYGPLVPAGQLMETSGRGGAIGRLLPINATPNTISRQLNTFLTFRKLGHYRITAETETVGRDYGKTRGGIQNPIVIRSNSIEFDIVKPEPGWAESQLQTDLALIAQWTPESSASNVRRGSDQFAAINGVRALGLLETREAALALVDFYGKGVPVSISQYIDQGLRRSPYSKDIIAAMEKQIDMPDVPITTQWFGIFSDLEMMDISNPSDRAKVYERSREKVLAGIEKKRGDAREISLRTLEQRR